MFGKIFELGSLMQQARQFGGKIQEMNDKLRQLRATGSAGGGMVTVEMNGLQEMLACRIDPALFRQEDAELLEELVVVATNEAVEQSRRFQAETMQSLTEGVDLGSLGDMLGGVMKQ